MQQLTRGQRFALVELALVVLCGAVWMIKPEWGIWFILIALLPLALRVVGGGFQVKSADWLVVVFLLTSWAGYWAAYDAATAWVKAGLVVTAVLLYFSLKAQPKQNLVWVSVFFFCVGVGVSLYYFLTHDFVSAPRKLEFVNGLGRWIMRLRPQTGWIPIHPNYVAGMIAVTVPFIGYPLWELRKRNRRLPLLSVLAVVIGLGFSGLALLMATSRGVVFAIVSGVGIWLLWRTVNSDGIRRRLKSEAVFPILLFVYLCAVVAFLYMGPAQSGSVFSGNYFYGNGSRAELFSRSVYLLSAYPITGGGLTSFPGLYSQYLLDIPFYNVPNSHNLFLDVAIEQGLIGGLSFLLLYLFSLWTVARAITKGSEDPVFNWIVLFSLTVAFVHGMVDDYLYNGAGTALSLFLAGLSFNGRFQEIGERERKVDFRVVGFAAVACALVVMAAGTKLRAIWYENLGAVQLAKLVLADFPATGWTGSEIVPKLDEADATLHSCLELDPSNRPANQRLGLISMLKQDFVSAVAYLEVAYAEAPLHRGIIKALGYGYVWLGDMEKAEELLRQIPEANDELGVYIWWWASQGRSDLSENASEALDVLQN